MAPFIIGTPQNRSFRGSDCLVLLVVLVARNGPAEFHIWNSLYDCEVYINLFLSRIVQEPHWSEGLFGEPETLAAGMSPVVLLFISSS